MFTQSGRTTLPVGHRCRGRPSARWKSVSRRSPLPEHLDSHPVRGPRSRGCGRSRARAAGAGSGHWTLPVTSRRSRNAGSAFPIWLLCGVEAGEAHLFAASTGAVVGGRRFDRVIGSLHAVPLHGRLVGLPAMYGMFGRIRSCAVTSPSCYGWSRTATCTRFWRTSISRAAIGPRARDHIGGGLRPGGIPHGAARPGPVWSYARADTKSPLVSVQLLEWSRDEAAGRIRSAAIRTRTGVSTIASPSPSTWRRRPGPAPGGTTRLMAALTGRRGWPGARSRVGARAAGRRAGAGQHSVGRMSLAPGISRLCVRIPPKEKHRGHLSADTAEHDLIELSRPRRTREARIPGCYFVRILELVRL